MIAGVMPFRAPLIAMTPAFESQNAFWDPVGVVPKRGGARALTLNLQSTALSVSEYFGA